MFTSKTFSQRVVRGLASGLVVAQLTLGAVSLGALATATPSQAASVLRMHGVWQGIASVEDGVVAYGAMTQMQHGGAAAFVVKDGELSLMLTNDAWNMKTDTTMQVEVQIDGQVYSGQGVVTDSKTIGIQNVSLEVLKMFVDGAEATININRGGLVWTLDLSGFTASMFEARRSVQAAY